MKSDPLGLCEEMRGQGRGDGGEIGVLLAAKARSRMRELNALTFLRYAICCDLFRKKRTVVSVQ